MEISKKKFIIIIIIVILIVLVPPIFVMKEVIYWKVLAEDTANKISQIDASELESKLIQELEKSKLNIDNEEFTTTFEIYNEEDNGTRYLTVYYELLKSMYSYATNPYEGYIMACIEENGKYAKGIVYIPCFKVERDNNGKVQSIIYLDSNLEDIGHDIVGMVDNILREEYNVPSNSQDKIWYIQWFNYQYKNFPFGASFETFKKRLAIHVYDYDFAAKVLSTMSYKTFYEMKQTLLYEEDITLVYNEYSIL